MIGRKLVMLLTVMCVLLLGGIAQAADEVSSFPAFPDIYKGTVVDQNGNPVSSGTIRAYIEDEFAGEIDFSNGKYDRFLVQAPSESVGKQVVFKVVVKGAELDAQSQGQVNFLSGKISGLDIPQVKITVDLTKIPPLVAPLANKVSGNYSGSINVVLSCGTQGAKIYFTTDGSDPKSSSSREEYSQELTIDETTTLKAVAERGGEYSAVKTYTYTIAMPRVIVEASTSSITLKVDGTKQIYVDTDPEDASLSYKSSNSSVVSVSSSGKVTAQAVGTATITITGTKSGMASGSDTVKVTVQENPIEITVEPESIKLEAGQTQQLTVTTDPSGAAKTYSSSNSAVARVSSDGLVTGVGLGTATITITVNKTNYEETTASVRVTVSGPKIVVQVPNFIDLPENFWALDTINMLAQRGIIGGYQDNTFKPNNNITRAEFTKILTKALGLAEESSGPGSFSDVVSGAWYKGSVEAAAKAGLIQGDQTGKFRPNANITRQEMAAILVRGMGKTEIAQANSGAKTTFADDNSLAPWARGFVVTAVQDGLVGGYPQDNTFKPAKNASRAEACTMIYRLMEKNNLL